MVDRYWVNGSGTWDTSTTTNWSATNGGTGGASAPTSTDNVFITSLSGSPTITIGGLSGNCLNLTTTGATCTFTSTGALQVYGNFTLSATTTWNATGTLTFTSSTTFTSPVSLSANISIAGSFTLASSLTTTGRITHISGIFNTNNFAINCQGYSITTGVSKTLNLGTSTVTINTTTDTAASWNMTASAPVISSLTLSATSSTINITSTVATNTGSGGFIGAGFAYGTVSVTHNGSQNSFLISGTNTYTNLTLKTTTGGRGMTISGSHTISGTFTCSGVATNNRFALISSPIYTTIPISAGTTSLTYVDFRDITASGTATWTGTSLGNAGGNTGITFTAAKTVYWNNSTSTTLFNASNAWATSSGGATSANNYPLPQDTIIFSNTGTSNGMIISSSGTIGASYVYMPSTITATGLTNTLTLPGYIFGNTTFTNCGTIDLTSAVTYNLRTSQIINGTGRPNIPTGTTVTISNATTAFAQLGASISLASQPINLFSGGFDLNGFNCSIGTGQFQFANSGTASATLSLGTGVLTCNTFSSPIANTRVINFGTGNITTTGSGTAWSTADATTLTYTGTPTVNISNNSATATTISAGSTVGGETTALNFNITTGTYALTITTSSDIRSLNFTGFTGTWAPGSTTCTFYGSLTLVSGMTFNRGTQPWTFANTSGTATITTAGKTIYGIIQNGAGGTVAFAGVTTINNTYTFSNGTLQLPASTTTTIGTFATSGTTLKYLVSSTSGTQATISSANNVTATYLSIKDSSATGGGIFNATAITNINAGNNIGWLGMAAASSNYFLIF